MDNRIGSKIAVYNADLADKTRGPDIAPSSTIRKYGENIVGGIPWTSDPERNDKDEPPYGMEAKRSNLKGWENCRTPGVEKDRDGNKSKHNQGILPIWEGEAGVGDVDGDLDHGCHDENARGVASKPTQRGHPTCVILALKHL